MPQHARFAPSDATLTGDNADVYFLRARDILEAERRAPTVAMEVFNSGEGVLCGINEAIALLARVLPDDAEVWALPEGTTISRKEVVLRIRAPYPAFAIYETAYLGMLAHETGWATAARACVEAAEGIPIISFGARHVHPDVSAHMEYAALVGGCQGCATPAGARLAGRQASGTMPHALILCYGDTIEAMRAFDRLEPAEVRRIALVDTFKDEAEESLRVAAAFGDALWGVRLDTPSTRPATATYALWSAAESTRRVSGILSSAKHLSTPSAWAVRSAAPRRSTLPPISRRSRAGPWPSADGSLVSPTHLASSECLSPSGGRGKLYDDVSCVLQPRSNRNSVSS
jgi:nicotinate phosphoribosyltransferase